jgi:magnesium-transporting ATPase (P-type)
LAQREIDPNDYQNWNKKYEHALSQLVDREKHVNLVAEEIEREFELIGSTAIEDKLQDNVEKVISDIRVAGIKFWVLTGDKIETAINIGFSCNVLDHEMEILIINEATRSAIAKQLEEFVQQQR